MSKAGRYPVKQKDCTSQIAEKKEDQQEKVQGDVLDQQMPISKHITPTAPSESQPSPDAVHDAGTETNPGDHRKPHSNSEAPPPKLFGLVVAQTPRLEQFIRELENEGALVFAVKGLAKPGPIRL
uniref:Uncharacterized protein n=1 Tax=Arundo donax TaxID=35708 RepID=A0A0A9G6P0_ARUDO